jgi:hypothetical protein
VEQEARTSFEAWPGGLFLILDDAESLRGGRFRKELQLLCDLFRRKGWPADIGSQAETTRNGWQLLFGAQTVAFIVNRSTDFFWQSGDFSAARQAYESGRVYLASNPFTYTTRSDKRLLEWLSLPKWHADLAIRPRNAGSSAPTNLKRMWYTPITRRHLRKESRSFLQTPARLRRTRIA